MSWMHAPTKKIGLFLLCGILLLSFLLPSVFAEPERASALDYGNPQLDSNVKIAGSDLLSRLYGITPLASEATYLDGQKELSFLYSDTIPRSIVTTHYNGDAGTLDVTLPAYQFTANNGFLVIWTPMRATIGEDTRTFAVENGIYRCRFEGLFHTQDYTMNVDFSWSVEIPAEQAKRLLNAAYSAGSIALSELSAYEAELATYQAQLKAYEEHQAYLQWCRDFEAFEAAMEVYEREKQAYDAYRTEYETVYLPALERYQAWRDYYAYLKYEAALDEGKYQAYMAYKAQVDEVIADLAVLESLFVRDSNYWTFYPSLMGNTVTQVVEQRELLLLGGCDPVHIEGAASATVALRDLMSAYAALRDATYASDHDKYTALFAFYTANYEALRDNFTLLYSSVFAIYQVTGVAEEMDRLGRLAHFQQFAGQLYVTTTTLDDANPRTDKWNISKKSLETVVEAVNMVPDDNRANPATSGVAMPTVEVERVEYVKPMPEPDFPDPVEEPEPPTEVPEPKAPQTVSKPPEIVTEDIEHPGDAPSAPSISTELLSVVEDIRAGRLSERGDTTLRPLSFTKTVPCSVSVQNLMRVTFFDQDGTTVLDEQLLDYGSQIIYQGKSISFVQTPEREYRFLGWIEADGSSADLDSVTRHMTLYAKYESKDRSYCVTWSLDDRAPYSEYYFYGQTPRYPFPLVKESTDRYTYSFGGWDKEIAPVTGDVTYSGSFLPTVRRYTVTWEIDGVAHESLCEHGTIPVYGGEKPSKATDSYRYTFTGWRSEFGQPIGTVTGDVTYEAIFSALPIATAKDGTVYAVTQTDTTVTVHATLPSVMIGEAVKLATEQGKSLQIAWGNCTLLLDADALSALSASFCRRIDLRESVKEGGTLFSLLYLTSTGNSAGFATKATLRLHTKGADDLGNIFYLKTADGEERITASTLSLEGEVALLMRRGRPLQASPVEKCDISALYKYAEPGERVSLKLPCVYGYEVASAEVTLSDGTKIPVDGSLSFIMPDGAVSIRLTVQKVVYTVTFLVDGTVYHTAQYSTGDAIVLPTSPSKSSDEAYHYTFMGWSPSVPALALGEDHELTYEAIFSQTSLVEEDPYVQKGPNRLFTVNLPIFLGVLTVIALPLWFFLLSPSAKRRRKERKAKKAARVNTDTPPQNPET
ncbi:MAG: InlB B-repeat-containing protein [Clostridia bacterium]|nr:InlB B-repeat-containing protein [Clostridia bacterium]